MELRDPNGTPRARHLRRTMTKFERRLWSKLRNHGTGFHFRRQHPVDGFFLDFYCDEVRLCVEVDGSGHETFHKESDKERDERLSRSGILTLRFTNAEVGLQLDQVVEKVTAACFARAGLFPHIKNQGIL